jgi:hypothetical protein
MLWAIISICKKGDYMADVHSLRNPTWEICRGIKTAIHSLLEIGSTILEFGSGYGSMSLSAHYKLFSIEHDKKWLELDAKTNYIHAPEVEIEILPGYSHGSWYCQDSILAEIPRNYDLILVDGPNSKIGRSGLLNMLDQLNPNVPWIIDDTIRNSESSLASDIAISMGMKEIRFWNFSILSKTPIKANLVRRIAISSEHVLHKERTHIAKENSPFFNSRC